MTAATTMTDSTVSAQFANSFLHYEVDYKVLIYKKHVSQVCNEINAWLIISKYKKNTMKRKEKLYTEVRR